MRSENTRIWYGSVQTTDGLGFGVVQAVMGTSVVQNEHRRQACPTDGTINTRETRTVRKGEYGPEPRTFKSWKDYGKGRKAWCK